MHRNPLRARNGGQVFARSSGSERLLKLVIAGITEPCYVTYQKGEDFEISKRCYVGLRAGRLRARNRWTVYGRIEGGWLGVDRGQAVVS